MTTTAPALITVEEFFAPPTRIDARISPDGTTVAYLAPWRDRLNVFARDVDGDWPDTDTPDDPTARRLTADDRRSIDTFFWSADSEHLLYLQDADGDENHHLLRVDPARPDEPAVDLTPTPGVRVLATQLCADRPTSAFVTLNARRVDLADLHEVDLRTGRSTPVAESPGDVLMWLRTPTGRVVSLGFAARSRQRRGDRGGQPPGVRPGRPAPGRRHPVRATADRAPGDR